MEEISMQFFSFLVNIVVIKQFIINYWIIISKNIPVEALWTSIIIIHHMSKYLSIIPSMSCERSPNEFHTLFLQPFCFVLIINSSKKYRVKVHVCKQCCSGALVSKWINLPTNCWDKSKLLFQELISNHNIVDEVVCVHSSFIAHTPSSENKWQASFIDKHSNIWLHVISLFSPPLLEESHLNISEFFSWIFE